MPHLFSFWICSCMLAFKFYVTEKPSGWVPPIWVNLITNMPKYSLYMQTASRILDIALVGT
jgi:hypothetical protein